MGIIRMLIVGGIIGWLAGLLTGRDVPGGIIGNIIVGFICSWLGGLHLGKSGTSRWWFCHHPSHNWIYHFSTNCKFYFTKKMDKKRIMVITQNKLKNINWRD